MKNEWFSRNCDNLYKHLHICSSPVSRCTAAHLHDSEKYPLIAIMAATTTRRVKQPHVQKIALFTLLLPSLIRSLDCGYRYVYVMGYDVGDPFYDSEAGMQEVQAWFARQIAEPMRRNGISITLKPVKVFNPLKKPGPVFVAMAKPAYELGANYFYRVNDDTEFRGRWPKLYVKALLEMRPPFGVVGPSSLGSVDAILTHDFVHRVHMEIFEQDYYPPELTDWWMDDWISRVYGKKRTLIAKEVAVMHHTYAHGQRYEVDRGNQRLVPNALKKGRELIRQWMVKNGASPKELKEFDDDVYLAKFAINQIRPS
ncbi:unnamed protein product [Symbiodinium microadriaticum]|nr:unnamed protein product [Symbiodinium microadriaticum]